MKRSILSAVLLFVTAIVAHAQEVTVHGMVLSKTDDEPLIGASILCESTRQEQSPISTAISRFRFLKALPLRFRTWDITPPA